MIEFHRLILGDTVRNAAFTEALRKTVKPGKSIVADIGSGTGYLAFLASRLGAKECHLYEQGAYMLRLSKEIARVNGISNCVFHSTHSASVRTPIKADIVISETLGNYALEENILETLRDAQRFLAPGGVMIPQQLSQKIAPIVTDRVHTSLDVWGGIDGGIDFSPAREVCFHNMYVRTLHPSDCASALPALEWDTMDFRAEEDSVRSRTVEWSVAEPATVYGFGLWWECTLVPGVALSTAPDRPATHWEQVYLPVLDPLVLQTGETLRCAIRSDTRYEVKVHIRWEVTVIDRAGKQRIRVARDMVKGQV